MWWIIAAIAFGIAGVLALNKFRWPLFRAAIKAQRSKSGLVEKRITVAGHDVVYLEGGSGEPLVLLHGFGANKDNWIQIAPLLVPHYHLIIPDLPGFGDSTRDPAQSYAAEEQIARLRAFIEMLGFGSVHIGGNSMGGFFAGLYAARFPATVTSAWLLAPAGVEGAERSEFFQLMERGDNLLLVGDEADFTRLVDMCFTKAPYVPKAFQRCLCERNVGERGFNEKIFADLFGAPMSLEREMANCAVRTLTLWGDNDRILHCSGARILGGILTDVETIIMQRMGHCPMLERPRETAALFLKFQGLA